MATVLKVMCNINIADTIKCIPFSERSM